MARECRCSVRIKDLRVTRGGRAVLDGVSFTVNHGESLALIGRNGAGKTTLLKAIISGVKYTGSIDFFDSVGRKITSPKIGYVPQRLSFDAGVPLTVLDLFSMNAGRFPVWLGHGKGGVKRAEELLKKVGAEKHINKPLGRLSGGELQRVTLAFALDPMPDILLFDEPISAVDRGGISAFYKLVTSLRTEYHMPIIVVSHDLTQIARYATSYALIDRGIIEVGKASDLSKSDKVKEAFGLNLGGEGL